MNNLKHNITKYNLKNERINTDVNLLHMNLFN